MNILGIIPARKGSKALPGKCVRKLLGKPVICYTIEAALASKQIDRVVLTTDDGQAKEIGRGYGVMIIDRPEELADDTARIDDALRHCCGQMEKWDGYKADVVVLLYGNVPVRAEGIIDKAIEYLIKTEADSVQTVAPVGKYHPYWMSKLEGDQLIKYIDNKMYRRQDLPKLYVIDGAVGVVKYETLMRAQGNSDPYAFWGRDRRGLVQDVHETVDIDNLLDFYMAEAVLRVKDEQLKLTDSNE